MEKISFTALRNIYENLGCFEIDDALYNVTEKEAISFGFNSRKEFIRHEINKFLKNKNQVESFIDDLQGDIKLIDDYLPDLTCSYKITINYLKGLL